MNTALAAALLTLCTTLSTTEPRAKPAESPAAFFPAHTYFYLQLNPFQTVEGFKTLQLTRLLKDPTLKALFDQLLQSIPPGSDLLARKRVDASRPCAAGRGVAATIFPTSGRRSSMPS